MRSKQWYTNASRLPISFVKVSIGLPRRLARKLIIGRRVDGNPAVGSVKDFHELSVDGILRGSSLRYHRSHHGPAGVVASSTAGWGLGSVSFV
jgi:hypothetical protein